MSASGPSQTIEAPIAGMDCADCARSVQRAIAAVPGVESADVLLGAEKAVIRLDPTKVDLPTIRAAVQRAGYAMPVAEAVSDTATTANATEGFTRGVLRLLGIVFGAVLFIVVGGEWFGLFAQLTERVPFVIGLLIVLVFGLPVFRDVIRATLRGKVVAHT
ncbi:MAG TPA: cation transporter, partial [Thermomicrobiales bacterium]|nr:cation transporter [Thermomicrobiales bacterium]